MLKIMRGQFSWFKQLFGFEESLSEVYKILRVDGDKLHSLANRRSFGIGRFSTPSVAELRAEAMELLAVSDLSALGKMGFSYDHLPIGDVLSMHSVHPRAVFQAASQFNCLEFSSSKTTPEHGVEIYAMDFTQGPACALACPAATVFRNYFVDVSSTCSPKTAVTTIIAEPLLGQRKDRQIDTLDALAHALDNGTQRYWETENGYVFSRGADHLQRLNMVLRAASPQERDRLRDLVKVGLHRDVEVVFASKFREIARSDDDREGEREPTLVTQVYASALSCAYSGIANEHWQPLAELVLEAMYEATVWVALCNYLRHPDHDNSHKLFLTFLGGGVFGNDQKWIDGAIARALLIMKRINAPLHVHLCHYRSVREDIQIGIDALVHSEL